MPFKLSGFEEFTPLIRKIDRRGVNCPKPLVSQCFLSPTLGARLRGRTATQRSKKGSEKVLKRVLEKGSQKGFERGFCYGLYSKKEF